MKLSFAVAPLTLAAVWIAAPIHGQSLKQRVDGVQIGEDPKAVASGGKIISSYQPYRSPGAVKGQDRARNRAVVQRFFELPIGPQRARLYAREGIKQIPTFGVQWRGAEAQMQNNVQNQSLFPGWSWKNVVVWDTQDPTVFWVEAEGETAPGAVPASKNHYVMQFVARGGKITFFREFAAPLKLTPGNEE